jgi:hypothetical protein
VANLRKFFRQSKAAAFFPPPRIRREKASSCRKKIRANSAASSLPQDCLMQLMFGAARFWRPGLSASRSKGFRVTSRGIHSAPRRPMLHKCFQQRWIFRLRAAARLAIRPKHLKRRSFSLSSAHRDARPAFGLPQRA